MPFIFGALAFCTNDLHEDTISTCETHLGQPDARFNVASLCVGRSKVVFPSVEYQLVSSEGFLPSHGRRISSCFLFIYYYYFYFICPPTIAGDSTNILLNFTIHDANAIDIYCSFRISLFPVAFPQCSCFPTHTLGITRLQVHTQHLRQKKWLVQAGCLLAFRLDLRHCS